MDYNKLLEKARKTYSECVTGAEKRRLESIFPELAEIEDEKIRKQLLNWFKGCHWDTIDNDTLKREDIIAWLEKQGEQKPSDKVEPKFKVGDRVNKNDREDEEYCILTITYVNIDEQCYICNQCSVIDFEEQDLWHVVEQNPAWSDEDELMFNSIINSLILTKGACDMKIDWLKSLKVKVQPHWKPTVDQMEGM